MKFTIKNHQVVFFYDQPLVAVSQENESFYISLAEPAHSAEQEPWLVCKVSKAAWESFIKGQSDLLSIMRQESTTFGTFSVPFFDEEIEYEVHPLLRANISPEWYPGPGFKLGSAP